MSACRVDVSFTWTASPLAKALLTAAAAALGGAVVTGRWELVAFAAPLLGVLCSLPWQRPPGTVAVVATPASAQCFEDEREQITITTDPADAPVHVSPEPTRGLTATIDTGGESAASDPRRVVDVSAPRWGRYPLALRVTTTAFGGLLHGTSTVRAAMLDVFPTAPAASTALPRTELPDRLGAHLTRHIGPGVEYADIRRYAPGDPLRMVNWPVSARRGRLHVTQRLTDRAADVVVLVDGSAQPAGPATTATERMVTGAVQVVQTALRGGDRAGVVMLGGRTPRWIGADMGRRQFYAVLDTVLGAGGAFETTSGTLAPRAAAPPGAIVVAFSTLLDTEFALALIDLRRRGHVVVAVDVLGEFPLPADVTEPLVARMWALQRALMYRDMTTVGVEVVSWKPDTALDQALARTGDQPAQRRRRR